MNHSGTETENQMDTWYVYIYIYTHVCMYIYIYICIYIYIFLHIRIYTYIWGLWFQCGGTAFKSGIEYGAQHSVSRYCAWVTSGSSGQIWLQSGASQSLGRFGHK